MFYEGVKIVFRVGVTMIKHNEARFLQCKSFTEIMDLFKEIPKSKEVLNCHQFMQVGQSVETLICNKQAGLV